MNEVARAIAYKDEDGDLEGIITEVDIKEVNSDKDIEKLLDANTGELKLENSLTIFVGGQVLDRGITIPSLISFSMVAILNRCNRIQLCSIVECLAIVVKTFFLLPDFILQQDC